MTKPRSFVPILVPSATVFLSSACIMILELVAGRLIARHLGSSLYTWTAVIGVVLAGITIGNYLGGRIADRYPARKALAVLFAISSAACVLTVVFNNLVGGLMWLWHLSWPMRVFTHVFLVFLIPSMLLGTISPVVAKMALDRGLPTGRTVGDIYAWGAAGSIAGTFLAGFYLIATMGTVAILWTIAAVLLLMAILYWAKFWVFYLWALTFLALMTTAVAPAGWAETAGPALALREKNNPNLLYEDETPYCYVAVERVSDTEDKRAFTQDKLKHSEIIMDDIRNLQYTYEQIHAAVTQLLSHDGTKLSVLVIGGGGFVFPRYIEDVWPGSRVDVAEIDPGVTEAAMQAFGLPRDTAINIFAMDARNYVEQLCTGDQITKYDFIYEDALNDYSIPYQLTTKEFNDKIFRILTETGVYMIELIDMYDSGLFLGAYVNTLRQTFPYVYVVTEHLLRSKRNTFVILGAKQQIDLTDLPDQQPVRDLDLWILTASEIEKVKEKAHGVVLTDNFAPVENMLAPVVRRGAINFLSAKYAEYAQELKYEGKLDRSIEKWKQALEINPAMSITAYTEIAAMSIQQGNFPQAMHALQQALQYTEYAKVNINMASVHLDLALVLKVLQQSSKAREHFRKAVEGFQEKVNRDPENFDTLFKLGTALAELKQFDQATEYLQWAVDVKPAELECQLMLAKVLLAQQRNDEAAAALKKAIAAISDTGNEDAVAQLKRYLQLIETKNNKSSSPASTDSQRI